MLKIMERIWSSGYGRNWGPAKCMMKVAMTWNMAWPIIIFHIVREMMEAERGVGGRSRISEVGASVERERAARESLVNY
jgi:hypothetical protein